jgi:dTDP-4-dehydrorhamnose 3,5-epimerase
MPFKEMKIQGAWINTPIRHQDNRGHFEEQFKMSAVFQELGYSFAVAQVNQSVSNKGVIRGIHKTDGPEGQAKYVSCSNGAIWDVVVDLRKDSPTYGVWDAQILTPENGKSILISQGLGHAFLALEAESVTNYLCSSEFNPSLDNVISPLDKVLNIGFSEVALSFGISELVLSDKDASGGQFELG